VQPAQLYAVPETVEVPAIKTYRDMMVNNRIVLIDPATSEVGDGFADEGSASLPVARRCTRLRCSFGGQVRRAGRRAIFRCTAFTFPGPDRHAATTSAGFSALQGPY